MSFALIHKIGMEESTLNQYLFRLRSKLESKNCCEKSSKVDIPVGRHLKTFYDVSIEILAHLLGLLKFLRLSTTFQDSQ